MCDSLLKLNKSNTLNVRVVSVDIENTDCDSFRESLYLRGGIE